MIKFVASPILLLGIFLTGCLGKFADPSSTMGSINASSVGLPASVTVDPGSAAASTPPATTPIPTATPPGTSAITLPAPIANLSYVQTFNDDFTSRADVSDGATFNGAKWYNGNEQCCMGDSTGLPGVMFPTVYNGRAVDPYTMLTGGGLAITLQKVSDVWYSGVLTSVDQAGQGFSQQYGYFEINAQISGDIGSWPAFWLLNESAKKGDGSNGGEIDVFEQYGTFHEGFCTTFHDWGGGTTPYYNCGIKTADQTVGFHKYAMLWTADTTTIYFDDAQVAQTPTPNVMKQPYYMLIDQGLGGGWPTDQTPSTSPLKVKSVRVYQAR